MSYGLIILTIVWFLLILSFLVLIHELGHFIAAKLMGVLVEEFGLGYPPRLKKLWRWQGTIFSLNALPFGGFVRLFGDEGETLEGGMQEGGPEGGLQKGGPEAESSAKKLPVRSDPRSEPRLESQKFTSKTELQRLFIILAGVIVNFVFGVLAFAYIYSRVGIPAPTGQVEIVEVLPNSPAAEAGLSAGDIVLEVEAPESSGASETPEALEASEVQGTPTDELADEPTDELVVEPASALEPTTAEGFITWVGQQSGQNVNLTLERAGATQSALLYVRTPEEIPPNEGAIGIGLSDTELKFYPWWQMPFRGMWVGLQEAIAMGRLILDTLGMMLVNMFTKGVVPTEVAGPIGIVSQAYEFEAVKQGFLGNLNTAALLSINLAIMNLLPIPALDGGRAIFIMIEPFIGRDRRRRWEGKANTVGFMFLIVLIVLITVKDIVGIVL